MASYTQMPASLQSAIESALGMEVAEGMRQNWGLVMVGSMLFGVIVVFNALWSIYKRYKYNNPREMDGAILKFTCGILLCNINFVIEAMVEFAI